MVSDPDQTARANIRASALELFASRGPDATSIRDIAAAAGVSPGLILHHYGSKQGLRAAVDAYVTGVFDAISARPFDGLAPTAMDEPPVVTGFAEVFINNLPPDSPIPAYFRRLLLADYPAGRELFRRWYQLTVTMVERATEAGLMRPSADPPVRAAFLMINDLATMLLHRSLADVVGVDPLTPDGIARWAADAVDAYTHGVFRLENQ